MDVEYGVNVWLLIKVETNLITIILVPARHINMDEFDVSIIANKIQ